MHLFKITRDSMFFLTAALCFSVISVVNYLADMYC